MLPSLNSKNLCPRMAAGNHTSFFISSHNIHYRFATYDLEYNTVDGRLESKILFILYAPDVCNSSEKFVYATSKESIKKKVQPVNKEFQVNDWADIDDESFLKQIKH